MKYLFFFSLEVMIIEKFCDIFLFLFCRVPMFSGFMTIKKILFYLSSILFGSSVPLLSQGYSFGRTVLAILLSGVFSVNVRVLVVLFNSSLNSIIIFDNRMSYQATLWESCDIGIVSLNLRRSVVFLIYLNYYSHAKYALFPWWQSFDGLFTQLNTPKSLGVVWLIYHPKESKYICYLYFDSEEEGILR